ncbi:hypothetical protein [Methylobacterium sp. SyP6R]|uniref:hypothetical protein n=1 Tax=Methylobacterium sp. SyP6R TaxID=2718876 RepID=UPI001F3EB8A5|nr:hypothetical protein [Methylobacterium sp. SyP6R]MCF4127198.1 hypothetical protein [Methylobacterium sp. SyP6R]
MSEASPRPLSLADRLEANAILDRLVAEEPTFPDEDARRLIALVPVRKARRLTLNLGLQRPGTKSRGHAAGHGDVELEEPGETTTWSSDSRPVLRIGGYEVTHVPGTIEIALLWSETRLDRSGQSCTLSYDIVTGTPREMRIARQATIGFFGLHVATVRYVPWKTPRAGG